MALYDDVKSSLYAGALDAVNRRGRRTNAPDTFFEDTAATVAPTIGSLVGGGIGALVGGPAGFGIGSAVGGGFGQLGSLAFQHARNKKLEPFEQEEARALARQQFALANLSPFLRG